MFKNILVLAPHTDDGEFGCGGYIAKLLGHGAKVRPVSGGEDYGRSAAADDV